MDRTPWLYQHSAIRPSRCDTIMDEPQRTVPEDTVDAIELEGREIYPPVWPSDAARHSIDDIPRHRRGPRTLPSLTLRYRIPPQFRPQVPEVRNLIQQQLMRQVWAVLPNVPYTDLGLSFAFNKPAGPRWFVDITVRHLESFLRLKQTQFHCNGRTALDLDSFGPSTPRSIITILVTQLDGSGDPRPQAAEFADWLHGYRPFGIRDSTPPLFIVEQIFAVLFQLPERPDQPTYQGQLIAVVRVAGESESVLDLDLVRQLPGWWTQPTSRKAYKLEYQDRFPHCEVCKLISPCEPHTQGDCPRRICNLCNERGHWQDQCPLNNNPNNLPIRAPRSSTAEAGINPTAAVDNLQEQQQLQHAQREHQRRLEEEQQLQHAQREQQRRFEEEQNRILFEQQLDPRV